MFPAIAGFLMCLSMLLFLFLFDERRERDGKRDLIIEEVQSATLTVCEDIHPRVSPGFCAPSRPWNLLPYSQGFGLFDILMLTRLSEIVLCGP